MISTCCRRHAADTSLGRHGAVRFFHEASAAPDAARSSPVRFHGQQTRHALVCCRYYAARAGNAAAAVLPPMRFVFSAAVTAATSAFAQARARKVPLMLPPRGRPGRRRGGCLPRRLAPRQHTPMTFARGAAFVSHRTPTRHCATSPPSCHDIRRSFARKHVYSPPMALPLASGSPARRRLFCGFRSSSSLHTLLIHFDARRWR